MNKRLFLVLLLNVSFIKSSPGCKSELITHGKSWTKSTVRVQPVECYCACNAARHFGNVCSECGHVVTDYAYPPQGNDYTTTSTAVKLNDLMRR